MRYLIQWETESYGGNREIVEGDAARDAKLAYLRANSHVIVSTIACWRPYVAPAKKARARVLRARREEEAIG